jgi:amidohydrolase
MDFAGVLERAAAIGDQITTWRRDIHQHPELGFQEQRTARLVAETLRSLGLEVATGVGKTGVVGVLGEGSPIIGIRADMDALPIQEINQVPYASQTPGVMHACGHDAHTAMLLGVARILSEIPDRPAGEIRFFFQPCEETEDSEGKSGATRMIEDHALEGVDHVIALHVASDLPAGKIVIEEGFTSANVDTFYAAIKGKGCHGAHPHRGIDPIFILAQVINAIQGIRARRLNPVHPAVVSIGSVHGGSASNVIPDDVKLTGTIRSFDDETRDQLGHEIEAAFGLSRALGGDYDLKIVRGCPSVYNDPEVASLIRSAAVEMYGEDAILRQEPGMGGEDFSYMARTAPGAMFLLGAKRDEVSRPHHSPQFDLNESVFPLGTALLAETTLRLLRAEDGA